jgi:hypothetical protein
MMVNPDTDGLLANAEALNLRLVPVYLRNQLSGADAIMLSTIDLRFNQIKTTLYDRRQRVNLKLDYRCMPSSGQGVSSP